jgi:hypothetical protein
MRRLGAIAAGICAVMFAFAFVAAPKSCEWGLAAWFAGLVAANIQIMCRLF